MVGQFRPALREASDLLNGEGRIVTHYLYGLQKGPQPVNRPNSYDSGQSFLLILLWQKNAIRDYLYLLSIMLDECSPVLNIELLLQEVQRSDLVGFGRRPMGLKGLGLDHCVGRLALVCFHNYSII